MDTKFEWWDHPLYNWYICIDYLPDGKESWLVIYRHKVIWHEVINE